MARRGFGGTALRAALGAVTGVAEGLQQRDVVAAEKERMADAAARTQMLDTISLLNAGYDPEGFSQDMPGATPRTPFDTQMVGTRKFTRAMSPRQMKHMEDVQDEQAKTRSKRLDASLLVPKVPTPRALRYTPGEMGQDVYDPNTGTSTYQPYAEGFTPKKPVGRSSPAGAGGLKPPTATDATKEAQGIKFLQDNAKNQSVILAIQKAIEDNPALAGRPGLVGYGLMQQAERKTKADAAGKPKTGGRALGAPPGMKKPAAAEEDDLGAAFDNYKKGGR
jgi:hypothetical protein